MISTAGGAAITSWNLAAAALYGWQPNEALGKALPDLVGAYPVRAIDEVRARGLWEGRIERRCRDSSTCTVRVRVARAGDSEWMEISSPIDVAHPAEVALAASEYRYRNLFGAVAASFWEMDFSGVGALLRQLREQGVANIPGHLRANPALVRAMMRATRIVDTNDRSIEMFGPGTKRDLIATPLDQYWPEASTPDFTESVLAAVGGKPRHVAETRMRARDGREFDALFTVSFLPGTVGSGTLLVGFTDISDRVQATRQLGEASMRRKMLMDVPTIALSELAAPEASAAFNRLRSQGVTDLPAYIDQHPGFVDEVAATLRFTAVNDATVRLFGARSADELIGRPLTGLIQPGCDVLRRSIEGSYVRELVFQSEIRMFRLDGTPVDTLFCRVSNPDPASPEVLVAQIDITEQVKARHEIDRMRQQAAHASRIALLGQLSASIVHEISQPITAIAMHASVAERLAKAPEPALDKLARITGQIGQNALRVGEIIQRIRALAANREIPMVPLALPAIVAETRLLLQQELTEKGVQVTLTRDTELPDICGDRIQLQQVLANLMVNAIQAMDGTPSGERRIDLALRTTDAVVSLEVADTGPGLPPGFQAAPFQSFRTTKPDGLGIGLTICRSIAEAHGGWIEVRDRAPGPGAAFTLVLPVAGATD
ncbi:PAS domain-containing sensor histidine kinase [Sphingomonas azotifigens]|uniref:PAS domain-containing sensor histidine kinase n=1 Tax=Sphingomonas azotifigens TaxID=330920 RepID=UPI000A021149|nr:ATP-binding protein [Sphingomonas azotifigens]